MLIKYIKSILWRVGKRLSHIEDARRLKVKEESLTLNAKALRFFETSGTCLPNKEREILVPKDSNLTAKSL